jgi:hypothetical protein
LRGRSAHPEADRDLEATTTLELERRARTLLLGLRLGVAERMNNDRTGGEVGLRVGKWTEVAL